MLYYNYSTNKNIKGISIGTNPGDEIYPNVLKL